MGKLIVGVGEMKISADPNDHIVTYALGSCLGLTVYDPVIKAGGMLHAMLPDISIKKKDQPANLFKYVNTGIPALFKSLYALGAKKNRIILKMAGCSQILDDSNFFNIGKRNYLTARKLLWKNNVFIDGEYCDKSESITMSLNLETGEVLLKIRNSFFPI